MKKDYPRIKKLDPALYKTILKEGVRQAEGLELIPSENYASAAVMEAMGSWLTNKYSEGYAGKRYYNGNEFIDSIEQTAIDRAKKLFGVVHANVQPYSGSPANLAVYLATCKPGDVVLGLNLPDGGHLTHGWKVSATGIFYKTMLYHVKANGRIDMDEVRALAYAHKPTLIWAGATAYEFKYDYAAFAKIADEIGAYLAVDIAHIAGLIVAGAHPDPAPHAHIITTTTHKTLRGPRGGMIMVTKKGLAKDADLASKIDKGVFPGLQGGPHDHQTAAIALALKEAATPAFKKYGKQIVKNAQALAKSLKENGVTVVTGGTENHLLRIDISKIYGAGGGVFGADAMEAGGMTANKNTIPNDPGTPFYPSGIRIGTPALTTRGMKEADMKKVGAWIARALFAVKQYKLPETGRQEYIAQFHKDLAKNKELKAIKAEIAKFTKKFPLPHAK
ncbi:MAG: serine hydroxymethyltransferase [Candidatus Pacebacteria bacterium]|nr:serine hydroxymethyltransferase [Candidatus Paceibacterota bacterium]